VCMHLACPLLYLAHASQATKAHICYFQQRSIISNYLQIMNISTQLVHQAIIPLEDVASKKSTKEHGYYIAVTSLNKIGEDSCMKHSIFLKSESFESIFLSTSRRQRELISNTSIQSSSVSQDMIDRRKQVPVQDLEARYLS